jgi:hypothetical protein
MKCSLIFNYSGPVGIWIKIPLNLIIGILALLFGIHRFDALGTPVKGFYL